MDVLGNRIAHCILNGLGREFRNLKYSLRARTGVLAIDRVSQQLLAAGSDYTEDVIAALLVQNVQQQVLAPGVRSVTR